MYIMSPEIETQKIKKILAWKIPCKGQFLVCSVDGGLLARIRTIYPPYSRSFDTQPRPKLSAQLFGKADS